MSRVETEKPPAESAALAYRRQRRAHWDRLASWRSPVWKSFNCYYHRRVAEIYRVLVPAGRRVLELGCGDGSLLAALEPELGVGVDFSPQTVSRAAGRYPHLRFAEASVESFESGDKFDYIILSDLVDDLWDVQEVFERLHRFSVPETRIILNTYSHLWQGPRKVAERLRLVAPLAPQNWLTVEDLDNLLNLAGFEVIRRWPEILWPVRTPMVDAVANRYLAKLWPFRLLDLTNFLVARPKPGPRTRPMTVSVVVPARNEEGNIEDIFRRVPDLGAETELVFVEGHSSDGTYAEIERSMARHPQRRAKLFKQKGEGKADAVRLGCANSEGDLLLILDADLTVAPEDLTRFHDALASGTAEFVNGVRLVYPMERRAMRFWNLVGNKFFSLAFSWLIGQNIKDTLCGTKALSRADYARIARRRSFFGDFDPFGDFELIFGAAQCNLKIVDLPIRYRDRVYGRTNISRWHNGWVLLRMVLFAFRRIKFR